MKKRGHGEGTIYQRPDGIWRGQVRLPGQRKTVYGKTRAEVQRKLRAITADAEQGIMPAPERLTVATFLERWLADDVSRLDQYTVKNYGRRSATRTASSARRWARPSTGALCRATSPRSPHPPGHSRRSSAR